MRTETDADALRGAYGDAVQPLILDVAITEQVQKSALHVSRMVGKRGLKGLLNNAGICTAGALELVPIAEYRRQFDANLFSHIHVIQSFLPLLRTV